MSQTIFIPVALEAYNGMDVAIFEHGMNFWVTLDNLKAVTGYTEDVWVLDIYQEVFTKPFYVKIMKGTAFVNPLGIVRLCCQLIDDPNPFLNWILNVFETLRENYKPLPKEKRKKFAKAAQVPLEQIW